MKKELENELIDLLGRASAEEFDELLNAVKQLAQNLTQNGENAAIGRTRE